MARILLIEDDPAQLLLTSTVLRRALPVHTVLTTTTGGGALEILATESVDLVLADLMMPGVDGLAVMGWMSRHAPHVPVIALSASSAVKGLAVGPETQLAGALHKPVSAGVLVAAVTAALEAQARGELRGFGLHAFLQLVGLERKTCLVEIECERDGRRGWLSFQSGELLAAGVGERRGDPAVLELFRWPRPVLRLRARAEVPARTVANSLTFLMLEAARLADEAARADSPAAPEPAAAAPLQPASWCTPEDLTRLVPDPRVALAFTGAGQLEAHAGTIESAPEAAAAAAALIAALTELGGEARAPGLTILHGQPTALFLVRSRRRADGAVVLVQGDQAVPVGVMLRRLESEEV